MRFLHAAGFQDQTPPHWGQPLRKLLETDPLYWSRRDLNPAISGIMSRGSYLIELQDQDRHLWGEEADLNRHPPGPQPGALPIKLPSP